MTDRLLPVPSVVTGLFVDEDDWTPMEQAINYLTQKGSDIASIGASNTIAIAAEFHHVTASTGTIDNIADASSLTPVAGQQVRLWFTNAQTIRNNGGGSGNIRTRTGSSRSVIANEILTFCYDGSHWREQGGTAPGQLDLGSFAQSAWPPSNPVQGNHARLAGTYVGLAFNWPFEYDPADDGTDPWRSDGGNTASSGVIEWEGSKSVAAAAGFVNVGGFNGGLGYFQIPIAGVYKLVLRGAAVPGSSTSQHIGLGTTTTAGDILDVTIGSSTAMVSGSVAAYTATKGQKIYVNAEAVGGSGSATFIGVVVEVIPVKIANA